MIMVLLPLNMLSGGMTSRESMPQFVQDVMQTMPTTHFVSLAQAILYRGADFSIVWPQFIVLIIISSVFFALALLRFRKNDICNGLVVMINRKRDLRHKTITDPRFSN